MEERGEKKEKRRKRKNMRWSQNGAQESDSF